MKKPTTLFFMCFLFSMAIFSQERNCSTMENLEYRKQQDPGLEQRMAQIETFTQTQIQQMANNRIDGSVITLPVVVHVLYRNSTENISGLFQK